MQQRGPDVGAPPGADRSMLLEATVRAAVGALLPQYASTQPPLPAFFQFCCTRKFLPPMVMFAVPPAAVA